MQTWVVASHSCLRACVVSEDVQKRERLIYGLGMEGIPPKVIGDNNVALEIVAI